MTNSFLFFHIFAQETQSLNFDSFVEASQTWHKLFLSTMDTFSSIGSNGHIAQEAGQFVPYSEYAAESLLGLDPIQLGILESHLIIRQGNISEAVCTISQIQGILLDAILPS